MIISDVLFLVFIIIFIIFMLFVLFVTTKDILSGYARYKNIRQRHNEMSEEVNKIRDINTQNLRR